MKLKNLPRALQLILNNKDAPARRFEVKALEGGGSEIWLYDAIDAYWGISAQAFVEALHSAPAGDVHLRINCPGGDVFEARAMVAAIAAHPFNVIAHIDGMAASAASYVAMACSEVRIVAGAFYMIHEAWTIALGCADELDKTSALLRQIDASIVDDYVRKTGQSREQLVAWMKAETWFSAKDAVEYKFADLLVENQKGAAAPAASAWDLSAYQNAPKALAKPETEINEQEVAAAKDIRDRVLQLLEIA